jgi:hypothetical protein
MIVLNKKILFFKLKLIYFKNFQFLFLILSYMIYFIMFKKRYNFILKSIL